MEETRYSTGSVVLNRLLEGGYETGIVTTIYGPSGSGKTNLCLLAAIETVKRGKKVIYMDSEGGLSVVRLKQLSSDPQHVLKNIFFLKPTSFQGQKSSFNRLKRLIDSKIGLIVVDTISMLYRLELGQSEEVYEVNKDLGSQIGALTSIARKRNIPVLVANQVYSNFDERDKVNMVGGDILKYGSKCLIELQKTPANKRRAILKKHRSIPEEKSVMFEIVGRGISEVKEGRGFRLF